MLIFVCVHGIGTNVDEAKEIIEKSGLPILSATDLEEAAIKAVESLFHDEEGHPKGHH